MSEEKKGIKEIYENSAGRNRNLFHFFLGFLVYVLVVTLGTTDLDLLLPESTITMPLINVDLSLLFFYIIAPTMLFFFHFFVLFNHYLHVKKIREYSSLYSFGVNTIKPSLFDFSIALRSATGLGFVVNTFVWIMYYLLPCLVLIVVQIRFSDYHHDWLTIIHFFLVVIDFFVWRDFNKKIRKEKEHIYPLVPKQNKIKWKDFWKDRHSFSITPILRKLKSIFIFLLKFFLFSLSALFFLIYLNLTHTSNDRILTLVEIIPRINVQEQQVVHYEKKDFFVEQAINEVSEKEAIKKYGKRIKLNGRNFRLSDFSGSSFIRADFSYSKFENALLTEVNMSWADLKYANLQRADLKYANLQGADLTEANLQGADLKYANLQGAYLFNANLQGAHLFNANLQGAHLFNANLQGADLTKANLQGADLTEANLQGTDLRYANLQGAHLTEAILQGAYLKYANLQGAHLTEAILQGAYLFNANLQGAHLTEAILQGANLKYANLQGAYLFNANLQGADLTEANLQGADLRFANLQGAYLFNANLQGADLTKANLQGADLTEANLQGAYLKYANLQGAYLFNAKLQGADLFNAKLQGADLTEANLQGADLFNAKLQGADLTEANLQGAYLKYANLQGANLRFANLQGGVLKRIIIGQIDPIKASNIIKGLEKIESFYRRSVAITRIKNSQKQETSFFGVEKGILNAQQAEEIIKALEPYRKISVKRLSLDEENSIEQAIERIRERTGKPAEF